MAFLKTRNSSLNGISQNKTFCEAEQRRIYKFIQCHFAPYVQHTLYNCIQCHFAPYVQHTLYNCIQCHFAPYVQHTLYTVSSVTSHVMCSTHCTVYLVSLCSLCAAHTVHCIQCHFAPYVQHTLYNCI